MFASAALPLSNQAPLTPARVNPDFGEAVVEGLTRKRQKTLPASWFYDELGSALFEAITVLPEYGLTRADSRLLERAAGEIIRASGRPDLIVELGSGTGTKTRHLLAASAGVEYRPIDISGAALDLCAKSLGTLPNVEIEPIEASYLDGIELAMASRRRRQRALLLFLGSTIGNFTRTGAAQFLRRVRAMMRPGDHLLLGADLVKPTATLLSAYDDPVGVTAAFNRNILARINRELDGGFDLSTFVHEARYNARLARVEMHLRSTLKQEVWIGALDLSVSFAAGETIWTESSHKFRIEQIARMGERAGWRPVRHWVDCEWGFAEALFRVSEKFGSK